LEVFSIDTGAVHLTYFAIANGKLSRTGTNASQLRSHYLNFMYSEWLDLVAHIVLMFLVVDINPEWIFPGFEVQHILTSAAQIGIRIQMTKFMCQSMKLSNIWVWIMMSVPYIFRTAWCVLMFVVTIQNPIPGFNFFSLLLCEAISFLYDLMIVKYADITLAKNRTQASLLDLFWEVIRT
jgi:hypothetical protein